MRTEPRSQGQCTSCRETVAWTSAAHRPATPIEGSEDDSIIYGAGGNDTVYGGARDADLYGGAGIDRVV